MDIPGLQVQRGHNPILMSDGSPFPLMMNETRDTLLDVETYQCFLKNAISQFRHSVTYSHYKAYLLGLGLDHCQIHNQLHTSLDKEEKMCEIEMHHNVLTIFDIALVITEHILNTVGEINTFQLIHLLKQEHRENHVKVVMLCKTCHQLVHNTDEMLIHYDMSFGDLSAFLERYRYGITIEIANKIIWYLNTCIDKGETSVGHILELRDNVKDWSYLNQLYGIG